MISINLHRHAQSIKQKHQAIISPKRKEYPHLRSSYPSFLHTVVTGMDSHYWSKLYPNLVPKSYRFILDKHLPAMIASTTDFVEMMKAEEVDFVSLRLRLLPPVQAHSKSLRSTP